jgi:hypothetical protein
MDERRPERLIALFLLGALLFSPALLALFAREETVAGVPLLFVYVFGAWSALVALLAWLSRGAGAPPER